MSKRILIVLSIFQLILLNSCKEPPADAPEIITKITGKISDGKTNLPISGVAITTNPFTSSVITGEDGNYTIPNITPGQYTITAKKDGYNDNTTTVTVSEGKTVNADIQLMIIGAELNISTETLDFDVSQTSLTFIISNKSKIGSITWQATANQPWIIITPTNGTTTTENDLITVVVKRDSMNYGNYDGKITINSDYGSKQINVAMIKQNPNDPQLSVIPSTIDFGTTKDNESLLVRNTGTGILNWEAIASENWIIISSKAGSATSNSPSNIYISLNKDGLIANDYQGVISFTSNGGNESVLIKMKIESSTLNAPTLQIIGNPTKNSISLSWTKIVDQNFSNYKIYRSLTSGVTENSTLVTTITNPEINNYLDNGLNSGTLYYYKVFVYNKNNIGSESNEVSASTDNATLDPPILHVVGTPTQNSISLEWTKTNDPDFSNYKIYRAITAGVTENATLVTTITNHDLNNFTDVGLTANTNYYYKVFVYNKNNIGSGSNEVSALTEKIFISWVSTATIPNVNTNYLNSNSLYPISENDVWFVNDKSIWHYDGKNWNKNFGDAASIGLSSVYFLNQNLGWVISASGIVYTYNGNEWTKTTIDTRTRLIDIVASSANDIWIAGTDKLFHFDGSEWTTSNVSASYIVDLEMIATNNIWLLDQGGKVFKYNGTGWEYLEDLDGIPDVNWSAKFKNISAISSNDIWFSCYSDSRKNLSGLIHFNGNEFNGTYKNNNVNYTSRNTVEMILFNEGWSAELLDWNNDYKLYHFDGDKWTGVASPINNAIYCIKMLNNKSGWAVGEGGEILRYIE